jgi:putative membrane protein
MKTFLSPRCPGRITLLVTAAGLFASTAYSATATWRQRATARSAMQGYAAIPLAADGLRENEKAFLGKAIETSRQQMRLAEVGASQAISSDVRSHALTLAGDYRELAESLDALIRRKGGVAGAPAGGTSENYRGLLEKSGADFDREFVRTAAALGNNIMTLFEQAATDARDPDVREFAAAQLPVLRAHRNAIVGLKKSMD